MEQGIILQSKMKDSQAIIIGDSTHNTLSVVRALGKECLPFTLILVGEHDSCFVKKSKYVNRNQLVEVEDIEKCLKVFKNLTGGTIICTFDTAAEWIDAHEAELSKRFITPCRGKQIGGLFNKDTQCRLAEECGLTVPKSVILNRGDEVKELEYPILIKPLYSTKGEKSDIHICNNFNELDKALNEESDCVAFIAQEFIDKEYELNCIGVSASNDVLIRGGIQKLRHYPLIWGACSYGVFRPINELDIDIDGIKRFLMVSNYHGPFSVEFLHSNGKNYFMEVNFRNDGLAQTATNSGANIYAYYLTNNNKYKSPARSIYMMNYSIDYLHVKEERVSKLCWLRDLLRARCFINFSPSDPMPTISYYLAKLKR